MVDAPHFCLSARVVRIRFFLGGTSVFLCLILLTLHVRAPLVNIPTANPVLHLPDEGTLIQCIYIYT